MRRQYHIVISVAGSILEFPKWCSWPSGTLTSNIYWTSVTPCPENRCVSSLCIRLDTMFISSCEIIMILFSLALYHVAR